MTPSRSSAGIPGPSSSSSSGCGAVDVAFDFSSNANDACQAHEDNGCTTSITVYYTKVDAFGNGDLSQSGGKIYTFSTCSGKLFVNRAVTDGVEKGTTNASGVFTNAGQCNPC